MFCKVLTKRVRTRPIKVVHDKKPNAEIHQGKCNCMPRASGAHLHDGCAPRALRPETFLEAMAPSAPVKIVAGGTAVLRNGNRVDCANLGSLRIHGVQERQNVLLEGIRDVRPREAGSLDRIEELWQPPLPQTIDIHQMIET